MIETGSQIRAARALLGWTRVDLAKAAGLHRNAVGYWEAKAEITRRHFAGPQSGPRLITEAFAQAGVTFLSEPGPGVCFVPREQMPRATRVSEQDARAEVGLGLAACPTLTGLTPAAARACGSWSVSHG